MKPAQNLPPTPSSQTISSRGALRTTPLAWYALALAIIIADQLSKYWVQSSFELYERLALLPFLDFTLVYNEGAAWSFLSDAGGWQRWLFTAISLLVSVVLIVWMARLQRSQWLLLLALACILGGAIGNLVDRVMLGKVVDFVLVYYHDWYFPAFNLADSAITVGAGFMILDIFVGDDPADVKKVDGGKIDSGKVDTGQVDSGQAR